MSKYKTLDPQTQRQTLIQAIQRKLFTNKITLEGRQFQRALMSTNKSIIFVQFPKKNHLNESLKSNSFQTSLQKIPNKCQSLQKNEQRNQQQNNKINNIFKKDNKKDKNELNLRYKYLPFISNSLNQQSNQNLSFFKQKHVSSIKDQEDQSLDTINKEKNPEKNSMFQFKGNGFGFRNLKQKYLQLRHLMLNTKRKSQLLDKQAKSRYQEQLQEQQKMDKKIQQHMDRYKTKDLFQTKLNGFKTKLYKERSHQQSIKKRIKQATNVDRTNISNFIVRRKMKSTLGDNTSSQTNQQKQIKIPQINKSMQAGKTLKKNSLKRIKYDECTPWQTDIINFQ